MHSSYILILCVARVPLFFSLFCSTSSHLTPSFQGLTVQSEKVSRYLFLRHGTNHSLQARCHLPSFFNRSFRYSSFHCRQRRSSHGSIFERLKFMQRIWLYALQPCRSSRRLLLPILHYDVYSLQQLDISYLLSLWLGLQTNTTSLVRYHPTKFDSAPTEPTPQYAVGGNSTAVRWFLLPTRLFLPKRAVYNERSE